MYTLIQSHMASMTELKSVYTLDEALKLYALMEMSNDVKALQMEELRERG